MEAEQLQEAAAAAAEPPVQKDAGQHSDDMEQTKGETAPETDDGSEMLAEDDGEEGVDWDLLLDTSKCQQRSAAAAAAAPSPFAADSCVLPSCLCLRALQTVT